MNEEEVKLKSAVENFERMQNKLKQLTLFFKQYQTRYIIISDSNNYTSTSKILYMKNPEVGVDMDGNLILGNIEEYNKTTNKFEDNSGVYLCTICKISETFNSFDEVFDFYKKNIK